MQSLYDNFRFDFVPILAVIALAYFIAPATSTQTLLFTAEWTHLNFSPRNYAPLLRYLFSVFLVEKKHKNVNIN